jgi:capsular exopolysaccharide synthesis family protein
MVPLMAGSLSGALRRRGGLVLFAAVLAAAVALVLSLLSTPMYRASADVAVDTAGTSIEAEAAVAGGAAVEDEVRGLVGDDPDLSVTAQDDSDVLVFTATSSNADNAALAANTHAAVYVEQRGDGAELIDPATAPSDPYEPDTLRNTGLAFLAGLVIGIVAAWVLSRFDSSIRSAHRLHDITDVPNLAVIPRVPLGQRRPDDLAAMGDPNSVEAEAYRTLRTAVEFLLNESGAKVLLVTSPRPGEGKSSVAANLAVVAAQGGRNVVLIDGDLRKPQVHRSFGVRNDRGLSSILTGDAPLNRAVKRLDAEKNLVILPAGPPPPDPAELLLSDRLEKAIEALAKVADLVVIDTPPVLPVTDSTILAQCSDAVLLAATVGLSERGEWVETMERLAVVKANVIGTVLSRPDSRVESSTTTYHYAPTAAPANWWVTQATEAERAKQPEPTDTTTVMTRDSVDELIDAGPAKPARSARESTSDGDPIPDTVNWAEKEPADHDRDAGSDADGDEGGSDGRLESPGSSDGDGRDASGDFDRPPLRAPSRRAFPPPQP